jgi:hypothetical protein
MKTIIEMARELGGFAPTTKFLEQFAALVRADEREAATLKANPWQPIETAPKDGTPIVLLLPLAGNLREGDRRVYEGRWHEAQEKWTSLNGFLLFDGATDWQPLPLPPTQGGTHD